MQSCRLGGALHTILRDAAPGAALRDSDTVRAFGQVRGRGLVHCAVVKHATLYASGRGSSHVGLIDERVWVRPTDGKVAVIGMPSIVATGASKKL